MADYCALLCLYLVVLSIFILFDAQCVESELFEKFCDSDLAFRFSVALAVWLPMEIY